MEQPQAQQPLIRKQTTTVVEDDDEEEESGLLFVNPDEEKRLRLEKEKQFKKKEMPVLRLKDGSQAMMIPGLTSAPSVGSVKPQGPSSVVQSSSRNFIQTLKNAQLQKRSQNLTFDQVKSTYKTTELEGDHHREKKALNPQQPPTSGTTSKQEESGAAAATDAAN